MIIIFVNVSDDIQEGRKIRISKSGTLNIYIAVDVSESINEEHLNDAKNAMTALITKVRNFTQTKAGFIQNNSVYTRGCILKVLQCFLM